MLEYEEAVVLPAALNRRESGFLGARRAILVKVDSSNRSQASLYIHRDAGRNLVAELYGSVHRLPDGTPVEGKASVGIFTAGFMILFGFFLTKFSVKI